MIIKFDGIDGCGKTTVCRAMVHALSTRGTVALISEFSSPAYFAVGSTEPEFIQSLKIREAAFDPVFQCDDIERQLLLHFLSRRKNRVEIPYLRTMKDFVVVDRSTLSNKAYASAINRNLAVLSELASDDVECANVIFWIDTPLDLCLDRIGQRARDVVELKGEDYFSRVRASFEADEGEKPNVHRLDGSSSVEHLVAEIMAIIEIS